MQRGDLVEPIKSGPVEPGEPIMSTVTVAMREGELVKGVEVIPIQQGGAVGHIEGA
jgi:hypothetical protein